VIDDAARPHVPASSREFTVLDWIGLFAACAFTLALAAFPMRAFREMYADFGAVPGVTELFLEGWVPPVLALLPAVLVGTGLRARTLSHRRAWVVLGFVTASLLFGLVLTAVYLPILHIAGAISAD
jgi:hypothetical protein